MPLLEEEHIINELSLLNGWQKKDKSLVKLFKTKDFPHTIALTSAIGVLCERFDHHPDYLTLKYSSVEVSFSTHSEGGITDKDIQIAKAINSLNL